jgi:hypothetical protein
MIVDLRPTDTSAMDMVALRALTDVPSAVRIGGISS